MKTLILVLLISLSVSILGCNDSTTPCYYYSPVIQSTVNINLKGKCLDKDNRVPIGNVVLWLKSAYEHENILAHTLTDNSGNYSFNWSLALSQLTPGLNQDYFLSVSKCGKVFVEIPISISNEMIDTNNYQLHIDKNFLLKDAVKDTLRPYVLSVENKPEYNLNILYVKIYFSEEIIIKDIMHNIDLELSRKKNPCEYGNDSLIFDSYLNSGGFDYYYEGNELIFTHIYKESQECEYYSEDVEWKLYNLEILPFGVTDLASNNVLPYFWIKQ